MGHSGAVWGPSSWMSGWTAGRQGGRPLQMEALELKANEDNEDMLTSEDTLEMMEDPFEDQS